MVGSNLAERIATETPWPLGVPVLPVQPYRLTPDVLAYTGSAPLRLSTEVTLVVDGHGDDAPAGATAVEWMASHPRTAVKSHNG